MKIQDLVYFKYLAEGNSFTKTAEHFFVSQPSISIALQRLEEEFGTKLITRTRSSKRFSLTTTGKILYTNTNHILTTLEDTRREIENFEAEKARLGYTPTVSAPFLPKILANIGDFKGKMDLVENDSSEAMLEMLRNRYISIAILSSQTETIESPEIESYPLADKPMKILVGKDHELATKESVTASDLVDYQFIVLDDEYANGIVFNDWAKKNNIQEKNIRTSKDMQTVMTFITSSEAISFMPDYFAENDQIVSIPINGAPVMHILLAINENAENSSLQSDFNDKLIDILT